MSTTVTVSPAAEGSGLVPIVGGAVALVAAGLAAVLTDDAECRAMLETARRDQREQRFSTIRLRTSDLGRFVQSAREANLHVRQSGDWARIEMPGHRDPVWVVRTADGLTVAGGNPGVSQVLVANSVSRLTQTLAARGTVLTRVPQRTAVHPVEFVATGADNKQLHVAVDTSGAAVVDALNHHGPECEQVAQDLAVAMEGTITSFCRKPEYFGGAAVRLGVKQRA